MKRFAVLTLLLLACGGDKEEQDLSAAVMDLTGTVVGDGGTLPTTPGPGSKYECDSSGTNAFSTYGATTIVAINERIFANVTTELATNSITNLGSSFQEVGTGNPASTSDGMAAFKGKLGAFLIWAYGGPPSFQYIDGVTYVGIIDMTAAHTGLAITQAQYEYFLASIVVPALEDSGVSGGSGDGPDDVSSCFGQLLEDPTFSASIVGH